MAERSSSGENAVQEAVYGIKSDVKTLQQLSSSGKAAQDKRRANHKESKERAIGALDSAIKDHFDGGANQNASKDRK